MFIAILLHGRSLPPVIDNLNYITRINLGIDAFFFQESHFLFIYGLAMLGKILGLDGIEIIFLNYWLGSLFLIVLAIGILKINGKYEGKLFIPFLLTALLCSGVGIKSHLHSSGSIYLAWLNLIFIILVYQDKEKGPIYWNKFLLGLIIIAMTLVHSSGPLLVLFGLFLIFSWLGVKKSWREESTRFLLITSIFAILAKYILNFGHKNPLYDSILFFRTLTSDPTYLYKYNDNLLQKIQYLPNSFRMLFESFQFNSDFTHSILRVFPFRSISIAFYLFSIFLSIHYLYSRRKIPRDFFYFIAFVNLSYLGVFFLLTAFNNKGERFSDFFLPISFLFLAYLIIQSGKLVKLVSILMFGLLTLINVEKTINENGLFKGLNRISKKELETIKLDRFVIAADPMTQGFLQINGINKVINLSNFGDIPRALNGYTYAELLNCHDSSLHLSTFLNKYISINYKPYLFWNSRDLEKRKNRLQYSRELNCLRVSTIHF